MFYLFDRRIPSVYKTVFYNEDDNIRLTRYWSSKDGKLILDIHSVGAEEYPGPEGNIQFDAGVWFAYNVFDRDGRIKGERFGDEARASFSRAAFRLADEFESRGRDRQAVGVLRLVVESDVPAAEEAAKRIGRISTKGRFL